MTTKELKIGNYIKRRSTGQITMVEEILTNRILCQNPILENTKTTTSEIVNFEPLELTEEWLFKLGFNLINRKGKYGNIYAIPNLDSQLCVERDFNIHTSYFFGIEYTDSPFENDENKTYNFSYNLRYVHQLQNLLSSIM